MENINGERNGKGKEYNYYGQLDFEGEYLNGKRNGKGKEYYKNGKKWNGKGYDYYSKFIYEIKEGKCHIIEYQNNGKKLFEGEYLNGERNGKGKEFNSLEDLIFEGEYLNGKGKQYDDDGNLIFEGQYSNGNKIIN